MTEVGEAIAPRIFKNEGGDWKKTEKMTRDIMAQTEKVESALKEFVLADQRLRALVLEAYRSVPKTDCLFYDSPLAPSRQTTYAKLTLKKLGWDGIRDIHTSPTLIDSFSKYMKDGCRWLLKFKTDELK